MNCIAREAMRKRQRATAGKPSGTSLMAGKANMARAAMRMKRAPLARVAFQAPQRLAKRRPTVTEITRAAMEVAISIT